MGLTQTAAKTTVKAKFFDGRRRWGGDWCPSGVSIIPVNAQYATCSAACGNVTTAPPATYATCTQACTSTRQNNILINQNNCRNRCCTSQACCGYTVHESEARCNCDSAVSSAVLSTLAGLVVLFNMFNMQQ